MALEHEHEYANEIRFSVRTYCSFSFVHLLLIVTIRIWNFSCGKQMMKFLIQIKIHIKTRFQWKLILKTSDLGWKIYKYIAKQAYFRDH